MSHNEERTDAIKEGLAALISGVVYGITNVISGSPLDVIKTKLQVQQEYRKLNTLQASIKIMKTEGPVGFFRGITGPIMGSSMFRSIQFASFEFFYTLVKDNEFLTYKIPFTNGIEPRVIIGGIFSGTCRAIIECPFEYTKVRRQIGLSWDFKNLYNGFGPTWCKAAGMMTTYFTLVDSFRRHTNAFNNKFKLFLTNGFCASMAFIAIWPFEIVKNRVQSKNLQNYSIFKEIKNNIKDEGVLKGLYRGVGPGVSSVFIRNGCSMILMQKCQKLISDLGFRKKADKK